MTDSQLSFIDPWNSLHLLLALGGLLERIAKGCILVLATHLLKDLLHELIPRRCLALAAHHSIILASLALATHHIILATSALATHHAILACVVHVF